MGSQSGRETGLVLVSHSASLAAGLADLAGQMAPDVLIQPAGGTSDGRLGTGYDVVEAAVEELLGAGCSGVVVLADLGSARMTAESVLDMADDPRLVLAAGAFVEGAVAAAVAAQTGADAAAVARTVADTTRQLAAELADDGDGVGAAEAPAPEPSGAPAASLNGAVSTSVTVLNPQGLHARPAALLARRVAEFDATVTLAGVDASSLLSLMGLGLEQGTTVVLEARGPQAGPAAEAVQAAFADGFGELP
ncbi:dihydroxyacetone kinase phosphoryl donor subunit DhaM [Salana multivorans]